MCLSTSSLVPGPLYSGNLIASTSSFSLLLGDEEDRLADRVERLAERVRLLVVVLARVGVSIFACGRAPDRPRASGPSRTRPCAWLPSSRCISARASIACAWTWMSGARLVDECPSRRRAPCAPCPSPPCRRSERRWRRRSARSARASRCRSSSGRARVLDRLVLLTETEAQEDGVGERLVGASSRACGFSFA